jgi:hypothetical protein
MKKLIFTFLSFLCQQSFYAQTPYSTAWFGPNANPVPEFEDARIPAKTTISLMADYYFGYGDQTKNGYVKVEFPLLPERVSFKIWSTVLENYQVTPELSAARNMLNGNTSGQANGDVYFQTRIRFLKEKKYCPSLIFNTTLKTASGTNSEQRRYFDTPGYYFDLEAGKSFYTSSKFISEIRAVADAGFMCWEIDRVSTQDDAPMYGGKLILGNPVWKLENSVSGYWGWIHTYSPLSPTHNYGDAPMVYAAKFSILSKNIDYFAQYQYGITDFPYHQIRLGVSLKLEKLTPKFVK